MWGIILSGCASKDEAVDGISLCADEDAADAWDLVTRRRVGWLFREMVQTPELYLQRGFVLGDYRCTMGDAGDATEPGPIWTAPLAGEHGYVLEPSGRPPTYCDDSAWWMAFLTLDSPTALSLDAGVGALSVTVGPWRSGGLHANCGVRATSTRDSGDTFPVADAE